MIIFKVGEIYECCRGGFQGCFMEVMNVREVSEYQCFKNATRVDFKVYNPVKDDEFMHSTISDVAEGYGLILWKGAPN